MKTQKQKRACLLLLTALLGAAFVAGCGNHPAVPPAAEGSHAGSVSAMSQAAQQAQRSGAASRYAQESRQEQAAALARTHQQSH